MVNLAAFLNLSAAERWNVSDCSRLTLPVLLLWILWCCLSYPSEEDEEEHLKGIAIQSTAQLLHQLGSLLLVLTAQLACCKRLRLIGLNLPLAKHGVFPSPGQMLFRPYLPCRECGLFSVCWLCSRSFYLSY